MQRGDTPIPGSERQKRADHLRKLKKLAISQGQIWEKKMLKELF